MQTQKVKHISRGVREQRRQKREEKLKQKKKKAPTFLFRDTNLKTPFELFPTFLDPRIPDKFRHYFYTQAYSIKGMMSRVEEMKRSCVTIYQWQDPKTQKGWPALQPTQYFYGEFQEFLTHFLNYAKLRYRMKKLFYHWNLKRMAKKKLNNEDPFTLMPCGQPIRLYDTRMKGYWEFEASALKDYICSKFMYHEELILEPQMPCHPLTNVPMTYNTLNVLFSQFYRYEMMPWICQAFLDYKGDLKQLTEDFSIPIKKECLKSLVKDTRDQNFIYLFEDFLADEFDFHNIQNTPRQRLIEKIIQNYPKENYSKTWISLFVKYYTRRICSESMNDLYPEMATIHTTSQRLIYHRLVLDRFQKLFHTARQ